MTTSTIPQPIRGHLGATDVGPRNLELDRQNPDVFAAPDTDHGSIPNLKFSFGMAHNRLEDGGWAREVTVRELPAAKAMAGVTMRLDSGVVRELHWHKEGEWGYVLQGNVRVTTVDQDCKVYMDDLKPGDVWFFPEGNPHSIQGLEGGTEFLLVFDDGNFSENQTLLITEWFAHTPRSVLSKNFGIPESHFANIPKSEKYIFRMPVPPPLSEVRAKLPSDPPTTAYTWHASSKKPNRYDGGSTMVIDVRDFPATTLSALIVELEPGAMRELHWHPHADEWQYYMEGECRMTVFDATSNARTFDYRAGDVGYVPRTLGHYIENTGTTTAQLLNVFDLATFQDISLNQWMALTPPELVQGHLNLDEPTMKALRRDTRTVVRSQP